LTRIKVRVLLDQGLTSADVARVLRLSTATVCYHRKRLGLEPDSRFSRRYDWTEIQAYYDEGHSIRECARRFGFSLQTWHEAAHRGDVVGRPVSKPVEHYLVAGGLRTNRGYLRARLIEAGLKEHRCEVCGIDEWQGKPISLALHHVNGSKRDNRLDNLQILCPNCHAQTPNFGVKNRRRTTLDSCAPSEQPE
jgi:5-methylcytosine-specific restriction endonuclease McrA